MTLSRRGFALAAAMALFGTTAARGAVYSLQAVQVNDEPIAGTNSVSVCPGDTIVTEIFISDWSADGEVLQVWQAQFEDLSFLSGTTGNVLPVGWDAPVPFPGCFSDDDCGEGLHCHLGCSSIDFPGKCIGPDHDPEPWAFIDQNRPNYVYAGSVSLPAVDTCTFGYRFGSLFFSGPSPVYEAPPKYGGTMTLLVSKDASGTFDVAFSPGPGTFMKQATGEAILPIELEGLAIVVSGGDGAPCRLAESDPPNCAIDPRQPSEPNGSGGAGWDRISLAFGGDVSSLTAADFEVDDFTPSPPQIQEVIPESGGEILTLAFDRRIRLGRWTCVTYLLRPKTTCVGSLPGDVDNDGTSRAADVSLLIEHLNGTRNPPLPVRRCDINRSGTCSAADLLRVIDLLNGGDAYDGWLDRSIFPTDCPSTQ